MNDAPQAIYLADYEAPNFSVECVELAFDLHEEDTIVRAAARGEGDIVLSHASISRVLRSDGPRGSVDSRCQRFEMRPRTPSRI